MCTSAHALPFGAKLYVLHGSLITWLLVNNSHNSRCLSRSAGRHVFAPLVHSPKLVSYIVADHEVSGEL